MAAQKRRFALGAIALSVFLLTMAGLARAATLTVTNTTDPVSPVAGDGSLRGALLAAGAGDTIVFASGLTGTIDLLAANGSLQISASITITGPTASPGIAINGQGAIRVMVVASGLTVSIANLTIENGFTGNGAGILNNGALSVTNCVFSGNHATTDGGGIQNSGTLIVSNSTFSGSLAVNGGGIFNLGTATVTGSTFSENSANGGAGIQNEDALTVINSTFARNSASDAGGGIQNNTGTLTVTNSTFSGNSATTAGGGIFNQNDITLKGTILAAEPSGGNCAGFGISPVPFDAGYNISDDGSCGFSGTSMNNSTTLNLDPAGLQNNGGPTQTIAIEPNSQALNFIPVASCKDQSSPTPLPLISDQRNFPRPDSDNLTACDAGAFELQTGRITVVPGSEQTQIARPTTSSNSDQVNMAFAFIDDGTPPLRVGGPPVPLRCDAGNDALNGISVDLFEGTCADLATATGGLLLDLSPFAVHSVGGQSYGTIYQSDPPDVLQQTGETVSARIVRQLLTPLDSCGKWTIHIEVTGLDTATLGLGGGNPFALVVEDGDKNEGCFDIDNAVVGSQLDPPHQVRRGSRRGRR